MKYFKFLDTKEDIEGMSHYIQNASINGNYFRLDFYTDLSEDDIFKIRLHMFATVGREDITDPQEIANRIKAIMDGFYHRVNVTITERIEDIIEEQDEDNLVFDTGIEVILESVEEEERNFVEEMIYSASIFLFNEDYINRKIVPSRYGRVRYLSHIQPNRDDRNWDQDYMVLATKRELDLISHNTNNIWITVLKWDNRMSKWYLHDRTIMNGDGIRLNNIPYEIT